MDELMTKLLSLLRGGNKVVQESALTALASTADTAQEDVFEILRPRRAVVEGDYCQREYAGLSNAAGESDRMRHVGWHGSWETTV